MGDFGDMRIAAVGLAKAEEAPDASIADGGAIPEPAVTSLQLVEGVIGAAVGLFKVLDAFIPDGGAILPDPEAPPLQLVQGFCSLLGSSGWKQ